LAALYFGGHALVDVAWWALVLRVGWIRGLFELDPTRHEVLNGFFLPDMVLLAVVSFAAAIALLRGWRGAIALAAVTTGGNAYAALYLAGWVIRGGHGWIGVVAMTIEAGIMVALIIALVRARCRVEYRSGT
jgi:hypothetical protein